MPDAACLSHWTLGLSWVAFIAIFIRNWFRVQAYRRRHGEVWEGRREDKPSRLGLYLQGGIVFAFIPAGPARPDWLLMVSAALAVASTVLVHVALQHLGAQWRINTVVTADHQLITSGPYALIRHPVYTAILGITVATAATVTNWLWALAAIVLYTAGTEIRIRAEDALLLSHFPESHGVWRRRTRAWIPWLR